MNSSEHTKKIEANTSQGPGRYNRFLLRWQKVKRSPTLIAALLVVAIYFTLRTFGVEHSPAQLRFIESPSDQTVDLASAGSEALKPVFSGEDYDSARRVRECGGLLMALSLSAFEDFQKRGHFTQTIDVIFGDLQRRSLLPPGIEIRDGELRSALSELRLNYRSDPLSFEIFSIPRSPVQGPAFLFRFPVPPGEANSIMYFQFASGTEASIPAQFSTMEQLSVAGWGIRHWRGGSLPLDESTVRDLREQDEWLKSLNQANR